MANAKLNFNGPIARRQPIRTAPAKFLSSKLRGHVERSEGQRLSDAFYPYKCLPVMFIDVELQDGVVIPKGTIVSLLTNQTNSSISPSGISEVSSSGFIPVTEDATTSAGTIVTTNIDDGYWGYNDAVAGLLVPCNGGTATEIPYSTDDVTLGTFTCSGVVVTAGMAASPSTNYCMVDANMPVGIVYSDVYQDIRGRYLNYATPFEVWGILCDYYIEVPYVDFYAQSNFASGYITGCSECYIANQDTTTCAGYLGVWKKHQYLYFYGTTTNRAGQAGQLVQSDMYGKFVPVGASGTTAHTVNTTSTAQTVGKLIMTDSRYPKDMLELVDTYPGSQMPGTETGGLPATLFNFVKDSLAAINGSDPTIETIVEAVQDGKFGMARIQLNI